MFKKLSKLNLFILSIILFSSLSSKVYAWDGKKDGTGTHSMIVTQALQMLENDMASNEPDVLKNNLQILKNNLHSFQLGSTFPDYDPNAYDLYQDHFWDPDTDHNFTIDNKWYLSYRIYETAETQLRKYTILAKNQWAKGNYENAVYLLGQAMHFIGDSTTPYHPSNVTAVDSPGHVKYETFVEQRKDLYKLQTANCKTNEGFYSNTLNEPNFNKWSKEFLTYWAKQSKSLYNSHSTMKHNWNDWDYSARHALSNAQISTSAYIYRFLNEVSGTFKSIPSGKIDELIVVIKTANDSHAGTDHYVYLGLETNDGKKYEWPLNNAGNDFCTNQIDSHLIKINNGGIASNEISKVWLRKAKFSAISDDWKPEYINLVADGSVVCNQTINEWFGDNRTYYLNTTLK